MRREQIGFALLAISVVCVFLILFGSAIQQDIKRRPAQPEVLVEKEQILLDHHLMNTVDHGLHIIEVPHNGRTYSILIYRGTESVSMIELRKPCQEPKE